MTKQKIFGNPSKTLGIARIFCDSSIGQNGPIFPANRKNKLFGHDMDQKSKIGQKTFGKSFLMFQFFNVPEFTINHHLLFFFNKINLTKQALLFRVRFFQFSFQPFTFFFFFFFRYLAVSKETKLQNRPLLTQATHFSEPSAIRHDFGTGDDKQVLQKRIAKTPIPKETIFCFRRLVELGIKKERFFGDKKYWKRI